MLKNTISTFKSSILFLTALQFKAQLSQNWVGYLANVGGAFGLCLGFSITTLAELVWLLLRIIKALWRHHNLIGKLKRVWNTTLTSIHYYLITNEK
jgi:hypothetical protein